VPRFQEWLATSPLASMLRTFAAIVVAMFIADGADLWSVEAADLRTWVSVAFASSLPVIVRWLNPADSAYGHGAIDFSDFHDVFPEDDD
jgi:hypothetical protein